MSTRMSPADFYGRRIIGLWAKMKKVCGATLKNSIQYDRFNRERRCARWRWRVASKGRTKGGRRRFFTGAQK
jgi:hypothetical protein